MTELEIPLAPELFWPLFGMLSFAALTYIVYAILPGDRGSTPALDIARDRLGLLRMHPGLFALVAILYVALILLLFGGLWLLIWRVIASAFVETNAETANDFLFYILRIAGLTTVLGATIAFPITLIRLRLARKQTATAEESLFNEKINAATELLYARRQYTHCNEQGLPHKDVWHDDITRRNAAIDRLERLAKERPDFAPDIARMLSVYVRELSRENPPESEPTKKSPSHLKEWAKSLVVKRTDMEHAVQALGRLIGDETLKDAGIDLRNENIDLSHANLQAFDLRDLCFDGCKISYAHLQGVNFKRSSLIRARMYKNRMQSANLSYANLIDADLYRTDLRFASFRSSVMSGARLEDAQLQTVIFRRTKLDGVDFAGAHLQGTQFDTATVNEMTDFTSVASMRGAYLKNADFSQTPEIFGHLHEVFGDSSVTLPEGVSPDDKDWPKHWLKSGSMVRKFRSEWREWQRSIGFDPYDPDTWDDP